MFQVLYKKTIFDCNIDNCYPGTSGSALEAKLTNAALPQGCVTNTDDYELFFFDPIQYANAVRFFPFFCYLYLW